MSEKFYCFKCGKHWPDEKVIRVTTEEKTRTGWREVNYKLVKCPNCNRNIGYETT